MVEIRINNSYTQVLGLSTLQFKGLRKELSYTENANTAYHRGGFARTTYLLDKKGYFPTGLKERALVWLKNNNIPYSLVEHRKKPRTNTAGLLANISQTPYPDQLTAVERAISSNQGIISMCTGSGKSLVIALIASRLNVRTLVVCPTLEIKKQLQTGFKAIFGDTPNLVVENIDSAALPKLKDFNCLIIDESHHSAAKTYRRLNKAAWTGIYYRFFLTATPFRNVKEEQILFESIAGKVVFELPYKHAVRKNYVVPVEAYYVEFSKRAHNAYTWQQVYSELVVNNQVKNQAIAKIINALDKPTLCLVKEIKHGEILSKLTGVPFANGQDETSRKFIELYNTGAIIRLIGTEGVIGEGVDTKPCENVIIAAVGKAKSAFMQKIGRAIRTFPGKESAKIFIFKDKSHKFLLRHFSEQCKILREEYNAEPIKLELGD